MKYPDDPPLEVWQHPDGTWRWSCWECDYKSASTPQPTHAEALAAALDHCRTKEAS